MSTESKKALVRRFYEEIDKGNLSIIDELVAEKDLIRMLKQIGVMPA